MPTLFVIAGPNGAGKSTYGSEFVNTFGQKISYFNGDKVKVQAQLKCPSILKGDLEDVVYNKYFELRDSAIENKECFAFEINMSESILAYDLAEMKFFKGKGYKTVLVFYDTVSLEDSRARVDLRVSESGHDIDPETLKTNFERSAQNFQKAYKIFDASYLFINNWSNNRSHPKLILSWQTASQTIFEEYLTIEVKNRFPQIFL